MNVVEEFKRAGFPAVSKVVDTYDFFGKHVHYRIELRHYLAVNRSLAMLSELAKIDPSRTRGHRRGPEAAERLLTKYVSSVKVGKNRGIQ